MKNEYLQQAEDFLKSASATISIDFCGLAINREWKEKETRPLYNVTITTPRGSYSFDFWDCIRNAEIMKMTFEAYAEKRYKVTFSSLTQKELIAKKRAAVPNAYNVLACLTKYDPGTFKDFCSDYGYDEDSRTAERVYFAVQKEYSNLCRIFTTEQMEALADIQ